LNKLIAVIAILLGLAGLGLLGISFFHRTQPENLTDKIKNHPVRQAAFWQKAKGDARPVEERVYEAPQELLEFLALDNELHGFAAKPQAAKVEDSFLSDLRAAIYELPENVKSRAREKLVGIYLVAGLGSTGFTDTVPSDNGNSTKGFIVLDPTTLNKTANEWASWRENTVFKPAHGVVLNVEIEDVVSNTRKFAIEYILLHELGHVLSIGSDVHPPWDREINQAGRTESFSFSKFSWKSNPSAPNGTSNLYFEQFPALAGVRFYAPVEKRIPMEQAAFIYEQLQKTNFTTLYASTSPSDDFAETFAAYVHLVHKKRYYRVSLNIPGKLPIIIPACLQEARCTEKFRFMQEFLR
jgi:hypothetical protein